MAKSLAHSTKKKPVAKKRSMKKTAMKRTVTKAMGKQKIVKNVMKKVTKKLVKKITAAKKKPATAGMVGKVVHYYDRIGVAILELTAPIMVGELLTFKRGQREFTQPVSSMQINHMPVEKAGKGKVVGIKVVQVADAGTVALRA